MNPATLAQLLEADPLADFQAAIVDKLAALITGITVQAHPGKADIAELIAKTVVKAPGISIGWSRMRRVPHMRGGYSLNVEWIAYIVAEAHAVGTRRIESTDVAFAIGSRLLEILDEDVTSSWGVRGVLPPENAPPPELKPMFTVKDQAKGTIYYAVTWTQGIADLGQERFPTDTAQVNVEETAIVFQTVEARDRVRPYIPSELDPDEE